MSHNSSTRHYVAVLGPHQYRVPTAPRRCTLSQTTNWFRRCARTDALAWFDIMSWKAKGHWHCITPTYHTSITLYSKKQGSTNARNKSYCLTPSFSVKNVCSKKNHCQQVSKQDICIALHNARHSSLKCSGMAPVNEGSHSFTYHPHVYPQVEWAIPAFTTQPHSITALWLVLISRPAQGRRLSWPGWLSEILRWFACPKTVTHRVIHCGGQELNSRPSSCKSNALATRLPSQLSRLVKLTFFSRDDPGTARTFGSNWSRFYRPDALLLTQPSVKTLRFSYIKLR